jgi:hypothetical protein
MPDNPPELDATPSTPIEPEPTPTIEPYVRWARVLFIVLAAVTVIGLVLLVVGSGLVAGSGLAPEAELVAGATPAFVVLGLTGLASLGIFGALVVGLGNWRAWAIHAVAPVCYFLIAVGVLRVAIALTRGEILVPLETIGALLVLTRPHPRAALPRASDDDQPLVRLTVIALIATYVLPYLTPLVVR